MDLETISTVLAVARAKSFSAASYIIPCAQSSVSRRVVAAESELNVEIFVRPANSADNSLHLTPEGQRIIPIMERIVDNYRELFTVASDVSASHHALRIGFMSNVMPPMSYSTLKAELYERHPNLDIEMRFDNIDTLLSDLKSRRLDAILFSCISMDPDCLLREQFDLHMLGTVGPSIGISELNPLARKSKVSFSELNNETFFMNTSSTEHIAGIEFFNESKLLKLAREEFGLSSHCQLLSAHMLEVRYQLTKNNKGVFISFIPPAWRDMLGISYLELTDMKDFLLNYCLLSQKNKKNPELKLFTSFFSASLKKSGSDTGEAPETNGHRSGVDAILHNFT
jgi:DNA-binding transcriptional LysR family regulator